MKKNFYRTVYPKPYRPVQKFLLVKDWIDTENYENRTLAPFPRLAWDNFEQIPGEFEEFLNDHAPYKNFLSVKYQAGKETLLVRFPWGRLR